MITRSKKDLTTTDIKELINECPYYHHHNKTENVKSEGRVRNEENVGNIIIFDTESYKLKIDMHTKDIWVPHQVAWGVYMYNKNTKTLKLKKKQNFYVSEIWIEKKFRNQMECRYQNSMNKHLKNLKTNEYPMSNAYNIIKQIINDIKIFDIKILSAYNIHYDFLMMRNLSRYISNNTKSIPTTEFNHKYTNPFRNPNLKYCDIMHNIGILYNDQLIQKGLADGIIFKDIQTKKIHLKNESSKSIYAAEYLFKFFFNKIQTHSADDDVDLEVKLMQKIFNEFGVKAIELNVMYPTSMYKQFSEIVIQTYYDRLIQR